MTVRRVVGWGLVAALLIGLVAAPALISGSRLNSLTDILILALFAVSYNLLFGYSGFLSFGHAAYFGLGAYATALCLLHLPGVPLLLAMAVGVLAGTFGGVVIGNFCVRLSGPYFAMLTLAFGQLVFAVAWKWRELTRGDDGFGGFVPRDLSIPLIGLIQTRNPEHLYYLVAAFVVPTLAVIWAVMTRTPFGNAVVSIRQNEERAEFLGYNVFGTRLLMYSLAAALAGLAGSLSAIFRDFVSTSAIDLNQSTDVVLMAFIGGTKSFFGPILGAAFFVYFGDFISGVTDRWQIVMGVIFIIVVLYAPRGLVGIGEWARMQHRRPIRVEVSPLEPEARG